MPWPSISFFFHLNFTTHRRLAVWSAQCESVDMRPNWSVHRTAMSIFGRINRFNLMKFYENVLFARWRRTRMIKNSSNNLISVFFYPHYVVGTAQRIRGINTCYDASCKLRKKKHPPSCRVETLHFNCSLFTALALRSVRITLFSLLYFLREARGMPFVSVSLIRFLCMLISLAALDLYPSLSPNFISIGRTRWSMRIALLRRIYLLTDSSSVACSR